MNLHQFATRRPLFNRRAQAGVTLVETTVVTSVAAVLAGLAAPSFDGALQRRHLEGAAPSSKPTSTMPACWP